MSITHRRVTISGDTLRTVIIETANKLLDDLRGGKIEKIDITTIEHRCAVALLDYQTTARDREKLIDGVTRRIVSRG